MAVLQTLASDLGAYAAADALLQSLRSPGVHLPRRVAVARAMQQAEVIPEHTVGGSTSSAHPTDGGSTSVQAPAPVLAATAVPAPAPLAPCAAAPAALLEGVSGVTASTVSSASPSCAFLLGVRSVLGMWESGLLLADEALSRIVSSLANFRTISSPAGVTSAPQAELPQAGWGRCAGRNCLNSRHVCGTGISPRHPPSCGPAAHSAAACCCC